MQIQETELKGVFVIDIEPASDVRGFFARTWNREEFEDMGLVTDIAQCSVSYNGKQGTLRGLHYQKAPRGETKIVRCTMGTMFDVVADLRAGSPTRGRWTAIELSATNRRSVYIPEGCAHGFQTLEDGTEVFYQISVPYSAEHQAGIRWDDPGLAISWPAENAIISERDRNLPSLKPSFFSR
ncbi:MAG: dTDP-4-dehydrorhamnose 3,5-epimerase [Acidobacteriota bacterium]